VEEEVLFKAEVVNSTVNEEEEEEAML